MTLAEVAVIMLVILSQTTVERHLMIEFRNMSKNWSQVISMTEHKVTPPCS